MDPKDLIIIAIPAIDFKEGMTTEEAKIAIEEAKKHPQVIIMDYDFIKNKVSAHHLEMILALEKPEILVAYNKETESDQMMDRLARIDRLSVPFIANDCIIKPQRNAKNYLPKLSKADRKWKKPGR